MEEVGPDNEIGLDDVDDGDVDDGDVVDVVDGGIINYWRSLSNLLSSSARGYQTASQWKKGRAKLSVSTR